MLNTENIYIFDLDDTLVWSPDWYEEVKLDDGGYLSTPGKSDSLKAGLNFIEHAKSMDVPERFKDMKLQMEHADQEDRHNTFFLLIDSFGVPIKMEELEEYFDKEELRKSRLRKSANVSPYAIINSDIMYYRKLEDVGSLGFNEEILSLYKKHADKAIILTARMNVPGMNEKIIDLISEVAPPPQEIYTQPLSSSNSGKFKGELIAEIASRPGVKKVWFFDDNNTYIRGVNKVLKEKGLEQKVNVIHYKPLNKPVNEITARSHHIYLNKIMKN